MDISNALAQTVGGSNAQVKQATEFLGSSEKNPEFIKTLVEIIASEQQQSHIRQAAAIYLKNFLRRFWPMDENQEYSLPNDQCAYVKEQIIPLMLVTTGSAQKQIIDSIELICITDFPEKWESVLPQLVQLTGQSMSEQNHPKTVNLLKATYSVLRRYRTAHDIEQIHKELAFVLQHINAPLEEEFKFCAQMVANNGNNPQLLQVAFQMLHELYRIFYCLNYVTLPESIEQKLQFWMEMHLTHLSFTSDADELIGDDEDTAGILIKVKADICMNLTIYVQKYEEEFQPFINPFMTAVWQLLTAIDPAQARYNSLSAKGMQMLTTVSRGVAHAVLCTQENLTQICERIVIPNLRFQESDEINFEENPTEYIRTDLEESNHLTRRSSACQLVQGLRKHNDESVTKIFASYVMKLLGEYAASKEKWQEKDIAFFLITALAITGSTRAQGATIVNELVPIADFLRDQTLPELAAYPNNHSVMQADALKFVVMFRSQVPTECYAPIIDSAIKMIGSNEVVVSSYAAACIERLLTVKEANNQLRFGTEALRPFVGPILTATFGRLSDEKFKDNEYLMRLVMRVLSIAKHTAAEVAGQVMEQLAGIIARIAKDPTIPAFCHYVFESVACLCSALHSRDPASVAQFENMVLPTMSSILQDDSANFSPYVYQLLAMFLELNPTGSFSDTHKQLLNSVILPGAWRETGNIPALTRLIKSFLRKDISTIVSMGKLNPILGIFQTLLNSSLHDHHGFAILSVVLEVTPWETLSDSMNQIFNLIFTRLTNKKTSKVCIQFVLFLCRFVHKYSFSRLCEILNAIKPGIINNVMNVWISVLPQLKNVEETQVATIMTTQVLCDPLMRQGELAAHWVPLAKGVAGILFGENNKALTLEGEDDLFAEQAAIQQMGLTTSYAKLVHSTTVVSADAFLAEIKQVNRQEFVVNQLKQLMASAGGAIQPALNELSQDKKGQELCQCLA